VRTAMAGLHGYPPWMLGGLGSATANAVASAAPATDRPRFPVLVFLEGLTGYRQMNTFQVEDLVSHGYAVAGVDQPAVAADVVLPDGRRTGTVPTADMKALLEPDFGPVDTVPTAYGRPFPDGVSAILARDVGFVLDQLATIDRADPNGLLTGRLDLDRAGLFGVSMGGIVGAEACRTDPRLRACVFLDSRMPARVVADGLAQPAMWLTRDAGWMQREGWTPTDVEQHQQTMQAAFAAAHADAYIVRIPGMFHADFTDIPSVLPVARPVGLAGPIGAQRAHDLVDAYSRAFFDHYLTGAAGPLPDAAGDPAVQVQAHGS
jgi:pimeloyl-ACP methyl ester carboxylesterase